MDEVVNTKFFTFSRVFSLASRTDPSPVRIRVSPTLGKSPEFRFCSLNPK